MPQCQICGNFDRNRCFVAREMMFGMRDEFGYLECSKCGCVQIEDKPPDISRYYPSHYYSFATSTENRFKRFLKRRRARCALGKQDLLGKLLVKRYGEPAYVEYIRPGDRNTMSRQKLTKAGTVRSPAVAPLLRSAAVECRLVPDIIGTVSRLKSKAC